MEFPAQPPWVTGVRFHIPLLHNYTRIDDQSPPGLGAALAPVAQLERRADHRQAGHCREIALGRIPEGLGLAQPDQGWPSRNRPRDPQTHQAHGHGQHVGRVIGTLRRELLDHAIVWNERHLRWLLRRFVAEYYHPCRTHLSLGKDAPEPRAVEPPERGSVVEFPVVGGLHHRYSRRAA